LLYQMKKTRFQREQVKWPEPIQCDNPARSKSA
jgi:hypothetical protein